MTEFGVEIIARGICRDDEKEMPALLHGKFVGQWIAMGPEDSKRVDTFLPRYTISFCYGPTNSAEGPPIKHNFQAPSLLPVPSYQGIRTLVTAVDPRLHSGLTHVVDYALDSKAVVAVQIIDDCLWININGQSAVRINKIGDIHVSWPTEEVAIKSPTLSKNVADKHNLARRAEEGKK